MIKTLLPFLAFLLIFTGCNRPEVELPVAKEQSYTAYFISFFSTFYAVNTATGTERWKLKLNNSRSWEYSPIIHKNAVYSIVDSRLCAYEASSGEKKWETTSPDNEAV